MVLTYGVKYEKLQRAFCKPDSFMGVSIALLLSYLVVVGVYATYWRITRISLSHIRGPVDEASFLLGNLPELYRGDAAEADLKWQKTYGDVSRIKGAFGEDLLLVKDPKALQYIYQTSGYHWPKMWDRLVAEPGLAWADGDAHKRQRKIMLPGFRTPEARSFLPIFFSTANKLSEKWKNMISGSGDDSVVLNVPYWLSRATLDVIGEAAFNYRFGGLDDERNELANAYTTLLLYDLHAFIIELISNFEFELTTEAAHIRRHPCLVVAPTIEGREDEGAQLPLRIRVAVKGE